MGDPVETFFIICGNFSATLAKLSDLLAKDKVSEKDADLILSVINAIKANFKARTKYNINTEIKMEAELINVCEDFLNGKITSERLKQILKALRAETKKIKEDDKITPGQNPWAGIRL